ncbi:MAG TPA: hypothetical protein VFR24_08660, partial [Candidatus Angelobacter sp.]|nr:hypothetical protein [Candidatus Angelobacter sp.]
MARRNDLVGWVRPTIQANLPALADEVARLSKENSELREQASRQHSQAEPTYKGLTFSEVKRLLQADGVWNWIETNHQLLSNGIVL